MNIICSTVEATTSAAQLIGTCIGLLSVIWSHVSGIWHCAEGAVMNPIISTICGPIIGGGGAISIYGICQPIGDTIAGLIAGMLGAIGK